MKEITVSIICATYNHEKYIRKALEGFLMQKTDFAFEVLIHDDASTDGTADIIREYEKKYPEIIKPIYEIENQYSKGVKITKEILVPNAKGKYIAMCEGDDCWISPLKLQLQVNYMKKNPKCTFCFSNAQVYLVNQNKTKDFMSFFNKNKYEQSQDFNLGELNELTFIPTCSFLFPKENYERFPRSFEDYCFGGDRKISLFSTALGYAHYFSETTCLYNSGVSNSAMTRPKNIAEQLKILNGYIRLAENLNIWTNYMYRVSFNFYIQQREIEKLYVDYKTLIQFNYYKNLYKLMPIKLKIRLFIKQYFPFLVKWKRKIAMKKIK